MGETRIKRHKCDENINFFTFRYRLHNAVKPDLKTLKSDSLIYELKSDDKLISGLISVIVKHNEAAQLV